jgi:hypothetical protein
LRRAKTIMKKAFRAPPKVGALNALYRGEKDYDISSAGGITRKAGAQRQAARLD